jgi:3-hydroxyisobutyrate dehydrogenase-like beta-hydroxyacid dehydrogenase
VAKICNNLILGISMAGVSEAFALGLSLGIDPKKLANIVNTSSGRRASSNMLCCCNMVCCAATFCTVSHIVNTSQQASQHLPPP